MERHAHGRPVNPDVARLRRQVESIQEQVDGLRERGAISNFRQHRPQIPSSFAEGLRQALVSTGINVSEAKARIRSAGFQYPLDDWLSGRMIPRDRSIRRICELLGMEEETRDLQLLASESRSREAACKKTIRSEHGIQ